jgi:hypothetical protein
MFAAKKIIFLLINLTISYHIGYCQQPRDTIIFQSIEEETNNGKDSIDKKHNPAYLAGKEDAKEYFNSNRAFAITFITSVLLPPVGLITTTVISLQKPTIEILDLPNKQLLKNADYTKGYVHKAKRMNTAKAWGGCITGMVFFGFAFYMLYGINY